MEKYHDYKRIRKKPKVEPDSTYSLPQNIVKHCYGKYLFYFLSFDSFFIIKSKCIEYNIILKLIYIGDILFTTLRDYPQVWKKLLTKYLKLTLLQLNKSFYSVVFPLIGYIVS